MTLRYHIRVISYHVTSSGAELDYPIKKIIDEKMNQYVHWEYPMNDLWLKVYSETFLFVGTSKIVNNTEDFLSQRLNSTVNAVLGPATNCVLNILVIQRFSL